MSVKIFDVAFPKLPFSIPIHGGLLPADNLEIAVNLQEDCALEVTLMESDDENADSRIPLNFSMTLDRIIGRCKSKNRSSWEDVDFKKPFPINPGDFLLSILWNSKEYHIEVNGHFHSSFSNKYSSTVSNFLEINLSGRSSYIKSVSFTKEIKWINPGFSAQISDNALKCGFDDKNNEIYLGRGWKNNSLLIVSVIPSQNKSFVACEGGEYPIIDYELLQDNGFFGWKMIGDDKIIPETAVQGGFNDQMEVLYIGRVAHERALIPGYLTRSNKILSVPFKGKELRFTSRFEILTVLSTKETINKQKAELFEKQLENLENFGVVPNPEPFECIICITECPEREGVVLRECLHTFCKDCLAGHVKHAEEAEIKCPYQDDVYSCVMPLQEREIRALVTPDVYQKHLQKSLRQAEHQMENTFHCMTTNCDGWCTYEANVFTFKCPVCNISNCINCKVIHDGYTCKEYQDLLTRNRVTQENTQSENYLESMIGRRQAMRCPHCTVIVTKISGCNHMQCVMCRTHFNWKGV